MTGQGSSYTIGDRVSVHPSSPELEDLASAEGVVEVVFADGPLDEGACYVRLNDGRTVAIGPAAMEFAP